MSESAYKRVRIARNNGRPTGQDYIRNIFREFTEFHGDRLCGDDRAVIAGIGSIQGMPVTVIGIEKGKNTQERIRRNFGSAHPEGYRKSLRLMQQAAKFHRPVLCIVDTAGAFCGVDAEEHGQGRAIADNLYTMADLPTPILSLIIGEGGSGGALALCHSDCIWMMEDAYFSVVSPESCANILWKSTEKVAEAASALSLTAAKLRRAGLIDRVCANDERKSLASEIAAEFTRLSEIPAAELLEARYRRFRKVGY